MTHTVSVSGITAHQAGLLEAGLQDPAMRASVIIVAALKPLSPQARERIMRYCVDLITDEDLDEDGD